VYSGRYFGRMLCSIFTVENSFDKSIFICQTTRRHIPEYLLFIVTATRTSNLILRATPHLGGSDRRIYSNGRMMITREMPKKLEENPAPMPLCTLRISQSHMGLNPSLLGEKPAPNRRSYDRARLWFLSVQQEGARGSVVG
jgi:hypothetical protein